MDANQISVKIAWDDNTVDSSVSMNKSDNSTLPPDSRPQTPYLGSRDASSDIREHMNIKHFEEIQRTFLNHVNQDGEEGFNLDMFLKVFAKILGGNLSNDQLTTLFNKIDANSDGTVSWDEFSTYMMTVSMEESISTIVIDERLSKLASIPHRDMIIFLDFVARERKYVSVSREGSICLWSLDLKLQRIISIRQFTPKSSWVCDAKYMHNLNKIVLITDDRRLCFFDVTSIKPRMLASVSQLEHNPLSLSYSSKYDDDVDLILVGDDGGNVNVFKMRHKFIVDSAAENEKNDFLTPHHLTKRDSFEKYNIMLYTRKCHNDWVRQVRYFEEMNAYVTCASENGSSFIIGDLERRTSRKIHVPQGVQCFDFSRRPSFLVTGGRDKVIRLWNPYVLSKPAGSLYGHAAAIIKIIINHEDSHIISLSDDKVIKIWNARNLTCLQTVTDRIAHRPDNIISSIFFDDTNRQIVTGSDKIQTWPLYTTSKRLVPRSHESAVVCAVYNESFRQIVSASQDGTVTIWDHVTGAKIFQYQNAHDKLEITSVCFDKSGRRLITGSRDGILKMWNYNNGQILKKMYKNNTLETTDIAYIEMGTNKCIVCVGWDRQVNVFADDPSVPEADPMKMYSGVGNSVHRGHEGDIITVAHLEPNWLATGSVDGAIVVWNLEDGNIRFALREPFLHLRHQEEKPVEKVLFMKEPGTDKIYLLSCHADGSVRFWDMSSGLMENELNVQLSGQEGLTSMSLSRNYDKLLVSGSYGHLRILDLAVAKVEKKDSPAAILIGWRAHVMTISSVNYVDSQDIILSTSRDGSVRLWTTKGVFIGIFGQEAPWNILDRSTYGALPTDVQLANKLESQRNELAISRREDLKKKVLETWKGGQAILLRAWEIGLNPWYRGTQRCQLYPRRC